MTLRTLAIAPAILFATVALTLGVCSTACTGNDDRDPPPPPPPGADAGMRDTRCGDGQCFCFDRCNPCGECPME